MLIINNKFYYIYTFCIFFNQVLLFLLTNFVYYSKLPYWKTIIMIYL